VTRFLVGLLLGLLVGALLLRHEHKQVLYWENNFNTAIQACKADDDERNTPSDCWFQDDVILIPSYPSTKNSPSVRSENSRN